jgi:hypothetical protein
MTHFRSRADSSSLRVPQKRSGSLVSVGKVNSASPISLRRFRTSIRLAAPGVFLLLISGCERAPNIDIIGSFFPVWMLCLVIAIALAFVVRALLLRYQLETEVGPLALFYPCVVLLFTSLLWLIFFR